MSASSFSATSSAMSLNDPFACVFSNARRNWYRRRERSILVSAFFSARATAASISSLVREKLLIICSFGVHAGNDLIGLHFDQLFFVLLLQIAKDACKSVRGSHWFRVRWSSHQRTANRLPQIRTLQEETRIPK